jgi:hypothetical protein
MHLVAWLTVGTSLSAKADVISNALTFKILWSDIRPSGVEGRGCPMKQPLPTAGWICM